MTREKRQNSQGFGRVTGAREIPGARVPSPPPMGSRGPHDRAPPAGIRTVSTVGHDAVPREVGQ